MMITEEQIDSRETQETQAWRQILARDPGAKFFYGVTTTGVYCRPECKSRRPLRSNTRIFSTTTEARGAGFRACLRCHPDEPVRRSPVAVMCAYLEKHIDEPVRLAELGKLTKMSPFTAQRLFKQAMSVTPAQYQRAIRANSLRTQLHHEGADVTSAIYEAGYGSSSRVYEQTPLGMTPGRFLAGGRGETIRFAVASCATPKSPSMGWVIIGSTARGLCWLAMADTPELAEVSLREEFPAAALREDAALKQTITEVVRLINGEAANESLPLDLRGTAFQLRVWKALQEIPAGETRTYSQLAAEMGIPAATRAVARACATNRVSVLVPCHRVIGVSGSLTGYRWGVERKRQLLNAEGARR
jgi:AraC family transcriptional regulator of adaptative response/methylated-DNA-[protein]-cysteine methyltransferase